jgi:tRNA-uridine 2-sulfurtransferase
MSGGVDSSVAAAMLLQAGCQVIGVTMLLWRESDLADDSLPNDPPGGPAAVERARQVAAQLGITHHVVDLRKPFKAAVVDYLIAEYGRGRTPNPCLACNRHIKFGRLLGEAVGLGASALATGHYVRTDVRDGRWRLLRGRDRRKDQSYVLYMLGQSELARALFPLGEMTKGETRHQAAELGLVVAEQTESQEICFIADNDYRRFLRRWAPDQWRPGPILDLAGRHLGQHCGLASYTIGQRKGLGIAAPEPLYVIGIDSQRNAVIAGSARELGGRHAVAENVSYVSGEIPGAPFIAMAKIRYQAAEAEVQVDPTSPTTVDVLFANQQRDITPGQGIVFYAGEEVVGGGIVSASQPDSLVTARRAGCSAIIPD